MKIVHTLGTSLRSEEEFLTILKHYQIEALIDVRSYPKSKLATFNRAYLENLLAANKIAYHFLGKELGGFRKGGYENYTGTESFHKGIDKLESLAQDKTAVVMCAERLPWKCHRRFIAMELQLRGWKAVHILETGKVWEPKQPLNFGSL